MEPIIHQLSLHCKDGKETFNEVSILQPLIDRPFVKKKELRRFFWYDRLKLKLRYFFKGSLCPEGQFKTALAHILSQDFVREYFLQNQKRRKAFFKSLKDAAKQLGYTQFTHPPLTLSSDEAAYMLTQFGDKNLLNDPKELNVQFKLYGHKPLAVILSHLERHPLTSCLEVLLGDEVKKIHVTTHYFKFHVKEVKKSGKIHYETFKKSSINQRVVLDNTNAKKPLWIGTYSGALSHEHNLLEQTLLILHRGPAQEIRLLSEKKGVTWTFLFTSLYSWRELEDICHQRDVIRNLNGKTLQITHLDGSVEHIQLQLLYHNVHSFHRLPIPAETRAFLEDINDEFLIRLMHMALEHENKGEYLFEIVQALDCLKNIQIEDPKARFLERQKRLLCLIDQYRLKRQEIAKATQNPLVKALILKQRADGKVLKGMDSLLYLDQLAKELHLFHHKNCRNASDRTSGIKAADKAQNALYKITNEAFLPGLTGNANLFKALYSLYLYWEEPELNAALSMGIFGRKFFRKLVCVNPDQAHYLMNWARKK